MRIWNSWSALALTLSHHRSSTWGWFTWTAVTSLALNIFWAAWTRTRMPHATAFTNYVPLHNLPLVNEEVLHNPAYLDTNGHVVATSFFTDSFATAVATLGYSLTRANTTARRVMMYIPAQVSPRGLCIASATGFRPHPVERIAPPNDGRGVYKHFLDQYTKLRLWELGNVGARGVVYLDADTLVLRNFDELFALPYNFAATLDVYTDRKAFSVQFNGGMLFLRPNAALFREMVGMLDTAPFWRHEAEQAFLNSFYAKDAFKLPYAYNANLAIKARSTQTWEGIKDQIRVIHYTLVKPFTRDNKGYRLVPMKELEANARRRKSEFDGMFADEMETWAEMWHDVYATHGERLEGCMKLSDKPGYHRPTRGSRETGPRPLDNTILY